MVLKFMATTIIIKKIEYITFKPSEKISQQPELL